MKFAAHCRWVRLRWKRVIIGMFVLACLAVDALAYRHAWSMTHFVEAGTRPPPPEAMSLGQKASAVLIGVDIPKLRTRNRPPIAICRSMCIALRRRTA